MYRVHYRYDRGLRGQGRARVAKKAKRIGSAAAVLLALLLIAGLIYTWLMGLRATTSTTPVVETSRRPAEHTPPPTDPNAPVGVYIQSLSSEIVPGSNASASIRTQPEAECVIKVSYQSGASTDSGLVPKRADEYGMVRWSWTLEPTTPLGKGSADITCTRNKKSGYMHGDITVVKELAAQNQ